MKTKRRNTNLNVECSNLQFCHLRSNTHFSKGKSMSFHKPGPHAETEAVNLFSLITVPILSPPPTLALPNRLSKHAQPGTLLLCTLPPRTPTTETLLPLNHNSFVSFGGQGKAAQWKTFALPLHSSLHQSPKHPPSKDPFVD